MLRPIFDLGERGHSYDCEVETASLAVEYVPIGVKVLRNHSTCRFHWSWRFGGAVEMVKSVSLPVLLYSARMCPAAGFQAPMEGENRKRTFVLVSGSTSHMRDMAVGFI